MAFDVAEGFQVVGFVVVFLFILLIMCIFNYIYKLGKIVLLPLTCCWRGARACCCKSGGVVTVPTDVV
jgi:hypothetical protein